MPVIIISGGTVQPRQRLIEEDNFMHCQGGSVGFTRTPINSPIDQPQVVNFFFGFVLMSVTIYPKENKPLKILMGSRNLQPKKRASF